MRRNRSGHDDGKPYTRHDPYSPCPKSGWEVRRDPLRARVPPSLGQGLAPPSSYITGAYGRIISLSS
jgi:hypothetical protein